jgi:hypothetical protein
MFPVTRRDGNRLEYRHQLDPGELFNNSFVAVSPDRQWLVSGGGSRSTTRSRTSRAATSSPRDAWCATPARRKVTDVLRLPKISECSGAYEAEGID